MPSTFFNGGYLNGFTLWLFNIAMENGPFIDGLPIRNGGFSSLYQFAKGYNIVSPVFHGNPRSHLKPRFNATGP